MPECFATSDLESLSFDQCHCVLTTSPEVTLDDQVYQRSVEFISYLLSSFGFASSWQFPAPVVSWTKP
ncbi:hypothetical protein AMECASPLE_028126 [Ameca splendens]|uniref:Uncharacterized protein n=1 Tax=Ameca splendens TaxID=208324 RepID=A0ABV0YTY4_9TELE